MTEHEIVLNDVGDVVVTEPAMMEALADPSRLRLFGHLQRHGPLGVVELADRFGLAVDDVRRQLEVLGGVGLARLEHGRWGAVGTGLYVELPEELDGQDAARRLYAAMLLDNEDLPRRWVTETAPTLPAEWFRAAGLFGAGVVLSPAELEDVQSKLEELLAPYTTRRPEQMPPDGRRVRILGYFLPEGETR